MTIKSHTQLYHRHKTMYILSSLVMLLVICTYSHSAFSANQTSSASKKIVKWKDEKGMTHYGDSVPAQYANRANSEMSRQGITVKQNKPIDAEAQAADAAKLEQSKKDSALLNAFTNASEIDLARDRSLQLDLLAVDALQQQKKSSLNALVANQGAARDLTKKNQPIPPELSAEIKRNQTQIAQQNQQINERKLTMEETRKHFYADKARFVELKNKSKSLEGVSNN